MNRIADVFFSLPWKRDATAAEEGGEDNAAHRLMNFVPLRSCGGFQLRHGPRSLEKHISSKGTRGVAACLLFRFGTSSLLDFVDEHAEDDLKG